MNKANTLFVTMALVSMWHRTSISFINFARDVVDNKLYNLDPEHQRDVVHDDVWKSGIMHSALIFHDVPAVYFHVVPCPNGMFVHDSLDGKQRCSAIIQYMSDGYRYKGSEPAYMHNKLYSELEPFQQQHINNCILDVKVYQGTMTNPQIEHFFQSRQETKITTLGEHLHSCMTSKLRKFIKGVLQNNSTLVYYLQRVKKVDKRHVYLEIIARLLYVYTHINSETDPENYEIRDWWKQQSLTCEQFTHFIHCAIATLQFMIDFKIKYCGTRGIYQSFFMFYVKHGSFEQIKEYMCHHDLIMPTTTGCHNYTFVKYSHLASIAF